MGKQMSFRNGGSIGDTQVLQTWFDGRLVYGEGSDPGIADAQFIAEFNEQSPNRPVWHLNPGQSLYPESRCLAIINEDEGDIVLE